MSLSQRIASALLISSTLLLSPAVHAGGTAEVKAVRYPAWVENGERRTPLIPGTLIRGADTVVSGGNARILLALPDGSEMRLGENARLGVARLEMTERPGGMDLRLDLKLLAGKFRYASDALARLTSTRKVDLKLSTATIGIRGTDFWAMTDPEHDAVCLFEGKVDVLTKEEETIALEQPTAFWVRYFERPAQAPGNATAAELSKFLSWVDVAPGSGVAVSGGRWRIVAGAEASLSTAQTLSRTLRERGYPALIAKRYGLNEVQINAFATRADAEAMLKQLSQQDGLTGNEAKVVAAR